VSELVLRLYVAGRSPRSSRAVANLQRICDERVPGRVEVEIIDVAEQPQRAEDARIIATPTLVREQPGPPRRVIGDLSDVDRVLATLGLPAHAETSTDGTVAAAVPADG
jgi:circadian clock protein KaiB